MPIQKSTYNWLFKYKLYHLPFWFVYHYTWWAILIGSPWAVFNNILYPPYAVKFLFYIVFQAMGVYFNLYFLIPRFLEKGKYLQYVCLVVATIIVTALLIIPGYYISVWMSGRSMMDLYQMPGDSFIYFFQANTLLSSAASMTLAMSVKLTKIWVQARERGRLLEKEKLETELKFLKSQFNPHFLFNTINSIFVLIHKSPDMASESLAKFSDMLRYQLYECNEQQIPVAQELTYLGNYIELEKLRQEHNLELEINIGEAGFGSFTIAPFILMPFVENAFKHVSKGRQQHNWIKIGLRSKDNELHFKVANSVSSLYSAGSEIMGSKGLGLKNVQRILDLVYPGKHHLAIQQEDDQFSIILNLRLEEEKFIESLQIA